MTTMRGPSGYKHDRTEWCPSTGCKPVEEHGDKERADKGCTHPADEPCFNPRPVDRGGNPTGEAERMRTDAWQKRFRIALADKHIAPDLDALHGPVLDALAEAARKVSDERAALDRSIIGALRADRDWEREDARLRERDLRAELHSAKGALSAARAERDAAKAGNDARAVAYAARDAAQRHTERLRTELSTALNQRNDARNSVRRLKDSVRLETADKNKALENNAKLREEMGTLQRELRIEIGTLQRELRTATSDRQRRIESLETTVKQLREENKHLREYNRKHIAAKNKAFDELEQLKRKPVHTLLGELEEWSREPVGAGLEGVGLDGLEVSADTRIGYRLARAQVRDMIRNGRAARWGTQ